MESNICQNKQKELVVQTKAQTNLQKLVRKPVIVLQETAAQKRLRQNQAQQKIVRQKRVVQPRLAAQEIVLQKLAVLRHVQPETVHQAQEE